LSWKDVDSTKFHRLFYPQVPVVISVEFEGRIGGMPAIWCMPLSFNPPLIGLGIAPEHETYRMVVGSGSFGVNWLDFSYAKQIGALGEESGRNQVNKLAAVGLSTTKGKRTSQPLIKEASAVLECQLKERHRTGTHELFVAEAVNASAHDHFRDYWDFSKYNPILYAGTVDGAGKSWNFMSGRGEFIKVSMRHQA
jgi:flavin reductase (DIM6/NTAB) family NADH-FMN oxidoreductase RutF